MYARARSQARSGGRAGPGREAARLPEPRVHRDLGEAGQAVQLVDVEAATVAIQEEVHACEARAFERALARIAKLPLQNTRILIHDQGPLGLESVYMKAELPKRLFPAFRAGVELVQETDYDGGHNDRSRFIERLLARARLIGAP